MHILFGGFMKQNQKRAAVVLIFTFLFCVLALTGCSLADEPIVKIRDLDFTVLDEDAIPAPLLEVIKENLSTEMKLSYQNNGTLYIARGFGEQKTGGYSIAVDQMYLAEDGIHVKFHLIGPSKDQKLSEEPSYPYLVIQTEDLGEEIVFE